MAAPTQRRLDPWCCPGLQCPYRQGSSWWWGHSGEVRPLQDRRKGLCDRLGSASCKEAAERPECCCPVDCWWCNTTKSCLGSSWYLNIDKCCVLPFCEEPSFDKSSTDFCERNTLYFDSLRRVIRLYFLVRFRNLYVLDCRGSDNPERVRSRCLQPCKDYSDTWGVNNNSNNTVIASFTRSLFFFVFFFKVDDKYSEPFIVGVAFQKVPFFWSSNFFL